MKIKYRFRFKDKSVEKPVIIETSSLRKISRLSDLPLWAIKNMVDGYNPYADWDYIGKVVIIDNQKFNYDLKEEHKERNHHFLNKNTNERITSYDIPSFASRFGYNETELNKLINQEISEFDGWIHLGFL